MVGLLEWTHCAAAAVVAAACILQCAALTGPNVCVEQQKYTVTKRVKYPGTVSIMTYEWCFAIPPRCPFRSTEVRDLTRLETEERIANVAMCCPGYKIKDVGCVPICPNGKTGSDCSLDCPPKKWGPNCAKDCKECANDAVCSPVTGTCQCPEGWKGERCEIRMVTTTTKPKELLTTQKTTTSMPSTSTTTETPVTTSVGTTTLQTVKQSTRSTESSKIDHKTDEVKIITLKPITETTTKASVYYKVPVTYTRAHVPLVAKPDIKISTPKNVQTVATNSTISAEVVRNTTTGITDTTEKPESTRKPLGTTKVFPTTIKFKPKEIWIRPAQKGESTVTETKMKSFDFSSLRHRNITKKEPFHGSTTPKTIIVSIIPTSVTYPYKKVTPSTSQETSGNTISILRSRFVESSTTSIVRISSPTSSTIQTLDTSTSPTIINSPIKNIQTEFTSVTPSTTEHLKENENALSSTTNSMLSTSNKNNLLKNDEVTKPNVARTNSTISTTTKLENVDSIGTTTLKTKNMERVKLSSSPLLEKLTTDFPSTAPMTPYQTTNAILTSTVEHTKTNPVRIKKTTLAVKITTEHNKNEDGFDILTEPEHITAVIGEKSKDRTSSDLLTIVSIAGGVMMAVITVAVIIVMVERCRKPRYDDVRKVDDVRINVVMGDDHSSPPPYVRSILHMPLPDPPTSEKCHYQPISTLDRNLKQFMRPVVVRNISPIMIENFRGILECHYDHVPRRSHVADASYCDKLRCSIAPSDGSTSERLSSSQHSLTTFSAIEALKCEAQFDEIDTTTSEPLYAQIPYHRPPSEHAVEVMNVSSSGEAVTEL